VGVVAAFSGTGVPAAPLWALVAPAGELFGLSVSVTPDVTGDGVADVVAGAPGFNANTGRVVRVNGATGAIISLVSQPGLPAGSMAGFDVRCGLAPLCDVDGNGTSDVIVGIANPGGVGAVAWFDAATGTVVGSILDPSVSTGGVFGCSVDYAVSAAGGFRLFVGAFGTAAGGTNNGIAWVIDPRSSSTSFLPGPSGSFTGFSVATAPADLDGDGFNDMLVGGPGVDAAALFGSAPGTTVLVVVTGPPGSSFGSAVADGIGILPLSSSLVGAPNAASSAGQTFVF
jgi:hypothetical protein